MVKLTTSYLKSIVTPICFDQQELTFDHRLKYDSELDEYYAKESGNLIVTLVPSPFLL